MVGSVVLERVLSLELDLYICMPLSSTMTSWGRLLRFFEIQVLYIYTKGEGE